MLGLQTCFFTGIDMLTFGGFIILVYIVASKQLFWWLIMLHERLMTIREYSKFVQSEDEFPNLWEKSVLAARFLVKIIRMPSECLRFTTIKMQSLFSKAGDEKVAIFWVCLGGHCCVLPYPVPFSS